MGQTDRGLITGYEGHIGVMKYDKFQSLGGGADKSLAQPTSRCHRMESIVSLGRGRLFIRQIASLFLLQRLKGSMSGDACVFSNIGM